MSNVKCVRCGLVNWTSESHCKRCEFPLTIKQNEPSSMNKPGESAPWFFSRGIMVLTVILGFAVLTLLLHRGFHLIDIETAKIVAVMFMLSGIVLFIITHLWAVLRIFEESPLLGLVSLFIGFLIIVSIYWEKTRTAFIGQLISIGIFFVGYAIVPATK